MCQFPNYLGIWGVLLWGDHSWSHWAKAWVGRISVILDGQRIGSLFLEWKRSCWEGILFKSGGERELWLRMFSSPPTTDQDDDQDKKNLASFQLDLFNKSLHWVGQKKHFFDLPLCLLNLLGTEGGHIVPPLSRICVYLRKYAYEPVEKTWLFSNMSLEKGSTLFTP